MRAVSWHNEPAVVGQAKARLAFARRNLQQCQRIASTFRDTYALRWTRKDPARLDEQKSVEDGVIPVSASAKACRRVIIASARSFAALTWGRAADKLTCTFRVAPWRLFAIMEVPRVLAKRRGTGMESPPVPLLKVALLPIPSSCRCEPQIEHR